MNVSRMIMDISSTLQACVQYESCTDANAMSRLYERGSEGASAVLWQGRHVPCTPELSSSCA